MTPENYRFDPLLAVKAAELLTPDCVELQVNGLNAESGIHTVGGRHSRRQRRTQRVATEATYG